MDMDPRHPQPRPIPGVGVVIPNWTMGLGHPHPPIVRPSSFVVAEPARGGDNAPSD